MIKLRHLFAALLAIGAMAGPAVAQPYHGHPHGHWRHPHFRRHHRPYGGYAYRRPPPAAAVEPGLYGPHPY